jgi:hypothetical protein
MGECEQRESAAREAHEQLAALERRLTSQARTRAPALHSTQAGSGLRVRAHSHTKPTTAAQQRSTRSFAPVVAVESAACARVRVHAGVRVLLRPASRAAHTASCGWCAGGTTRAAAAADVGPAGRARRRGGAHARRARGGVCAARHGMLHGIAGVRFAVSMSYGSVPRRAVSSAVRRAHGRAADTAPRGPQATRARVRACSWRATAPRSCASSPTSSRTSRSPKSGAPRACARRARPGNVCRTRASSAARARELGCAVSAPGRNRRASARGARAAAARAARSAGA